MIGLATSRPHEFLNERSDLFRPQSGRASDEVILSPKKDFFESLAKVKYSLRIIASSR